MERTMRIDGLPRDIRCFSVDEGFGTQERRAIVLDLNFSFAIHHSFLRQPFRLE